MTSETGDPGRRHSRRRLAANRARLLAELGDLIRIPSVSALPAHRDDMVRAAEWLAARLRAAGAPEVEVLPTAGHPVVWGGWPAADPAAPTVLIYGHYDTQPADPFDLWETPPFEPSVRDGRLYARGASDDKGNLLLPVAVAEAFGQLAGRTAGRPDLPLRGRGGDRLAEPAPLPRRAPRPPARRASRSAPTAGCGATNSHRSSSASKGLAGCSSTRTARRAISTPACTAGWPRTRSTRSPWSWRA